MASSFVKTESIDNLNAVISDLEKERSEKIREYRQSLPRPDWYLSMWAYSGGDAGFENYGCSRSYFEYLRQLAAFTAPTYIDYADKKWPYQRTYWESLQHQRRLADWLSWLSPVGLYRAISNSICYVDALSQEQFMESIRQYRETFIQYLRDEHLFNDFRYITPTKPEDMMTADQMVYRMTGGEFKTVQALDAWNDKQPDPNAYFTKLRKVHVQGFRPDDYEYLNLDGVPRFPWEKRSLLTGLHTSIIQTMVLIMVTLILFYLAYLAIMRYDVR
jgi:hypothetical protein